MFQVMLPTGTIITVLVETQTKSPYLNVWVQGSVNDLDNTKGLCGMFDGMKGNDLQKSDGELYNVPGLVKEALSLSWR